MIPALQSALGHGTQPVAFIQFRTDRMRGNSLFEFRKDFVDCLKRGRLAKRFI
jgi:hypothetical protein